MSYPLYGNVIIDSSNSTTLGGTLIISNSCKTSVLNNQASIAFAVADISYGTLNTGLFSNNVDSADVRINAIIDTVSPTVGTALSVSVSPNHSNPPVEALRIRSNGNVGIGTQTPQFSLDVNGNIRSNDLILNNTRIHLGTNAGQTTQGGNAIAIGTNAGQTTQGGNAIAIGFNAGSSTQRIGGIAIGDYAGLTTQGGNAIAIGTNAGQTTQGGNAIAIGFNAGRSSQVTTAIAIGEGAGEISQGSGSIAIGKNAGNSGQALNSIQINATGVSIAQTTASTCVIAPVRNVVQLATDASGGTILNHILNYNSSTTEITRQPFTFVPWTTVINRIDTDASFASPNFGYLVECTSTAGVILTPPPTAGRVSGSKVVAQYSIVGKILYYSFTYYTPSAGTSGATSSVYTYRVPLPSTNYVSPLLNNNKDSLDINGGRGFRVGYGDFTVTANGSDHMNCYYYPNSNNNLPYITMVTLTSSSYYQNSGATIIPRFGIENKFHLSFMVEIPLA